jgi:isoleucyl-tRNA synthetase
VHLCDWPKYDAAVIDEGLNRDMAVVMKLVSVGHAARNKANRKVRQPLAEAAFAVGSADEARVVAAYADLLEDELNVKNVRTLDAAGEAVAYSLNPLPRQLGQKYGNRFPALRRALLAAEPEFAARRLLDGQTVELMVDGETVQILPEEVEVRMQAREGYAVASEGAYLAALVTDLTPELVREGLAREFVRRVQDLRKQGDFEISNRIRLNYDQATPVLQDAIDDFKDYITTETLTVQLTHAAPGEGYITESFEFDGEKVVVGIQVAG